MRFLALEAMVAAILPNPVKPPGLWSDRGVFGGGIPRQDQIHVAVSALPYRQRSVWRLVAADRALCYLADREHYAGLYYPIIVTGITFIVGSLLLKETRSVLIWREMETPPGE